MAYTFNKLASGKVDILENGKSIYGANTPGVSADYAKTLGYTDAPAPADTATTPSGAKVNVNTGALISGPTVSTPSPIVYSADALKNPSTLFSTPVAPAAPNYGAMIASVPTIESIAGAKSAAQTKAESEQSSLQSQILDVLKGIGTKSSFTATQEANAGIPDINKNLNDVSAQIAVLQNEAKAIPMQIQQESIGRGRTYTGVAPLEADALRTNAIKALTLSSIAEVYRGNLANAQAQVDRAVAAEFDPKQAQLDYLSAALQINASHMTDADREQATIISAKIQERQNQIDQAKTDRADTLKTVLAAAKNGAPAALLTTASTQDPTTAATTLASYLKEGDSGFTLSAGQTRYDAQGNPIASVPKSTDGGTGGGTATFTQKQLNTGAARAGLPIAQFETLDPDTQNYFINSYGAFQTNVLNKVANNEMTKQEAADIVNTSTSVPTPAKQYLLSILGVNAADASNGSGGGGGFWSGVGSVLGGAAKTAAGFFFGI